MPLIREEVKHGFDLQSAQAIYVPPKQRAPVRGRLKELNVEMWKVLLDPRATRLERLEAGRIIAALYGVLAPSGIGEAALSTKAVAQLRAARVEIAERLFKRKRQKRGQNQRAYVAPADQAP